MEAKSEFAQKLLHDLRLRKERLAAAQSSSNSKSMSRGSYGSPGQAYKGSWQIKALESIGSRSGNSFRSTNNRDNRSSFTIEDSSKQLVPYGRGTNAGQVGDLSAALAYAFGYGGNLSKMDASGNIAMINSLHQIGRRSMEGVKIEISSDFGRSSRNTHFPTFSYMHVNEIEKGVQKLNQVLRACSNGLKFERFSVVGKELLKGAMDLEESLRMLVSMQEASDYMMSNQRKNRIKLLEDDEEDDSESTKLSDLKQIDRPRFSFDKPSRNTERTKGATKNGIKQQLLALTYPDENNPRLDVKLSHSESNLSSHTRSASCVTDYRTLSTFLGTKIGSVSSNSKPEKGRIPNVIAKLMGLEELPAKGDSKAAQQTEVSSRRSSMMVSKKRAISVDSLPQDTENRPPLSTKTSAASSEMTPTQDTRLMLITETFLATSNGGSKVVISEENSRWKDLEIEAKTDARSVSRIATVVMDKGQNRIKEPDVMSGQTIVEKKGEEENNKKNEEKKISTKTAESKELVLNDEPQHKSLERRRVSGDIESEHIGIKSNAVKTGNKNAGSPFLSKMQKNQHDRKLQQPQGLKKFERLEEKRKQQLPKQKLGPREPKGNQKESIVAPQAKNSANCLQKKQPSPNLAMASKKKSMKHIDEKPLKSLSNSKNDVDLGSKEASIRSPQQQENAKRRSGTLNHSAKEPKTLSPVQQEMKQQIDNKIYAAKGGEQENETHSKKAEVDFEFSETEVSPPQPSKASAESFDVAEDVIFNNCREIVKEMDGAPNDCQEGGQLPDSVDDTQSKSLTAILTHNGVLMHAPTPDVARNHDGSTGSNLFQDEPKKIASSGASDLLTESEKHLKEVLIKGQLFVNTAEALFKLDIPVGILHVMDQSDQDTQTKIILDCGSELLKKKGRRQELAVYPCKEMSIGFVKVKSFDDLIKQLSKDFECLRFYGGKEGNDCDAADYLYKMLEKDIQNRDPDMNSMWDFGWDEKKFAFLEKDDIVRDVEKHMLNALLDEIINDLLKIVILAAKC